MTPTSPTRSAAPYGPPPLTLHNTSTNPGQAHVALLGPAGGAVTS
jgi:hypothetical protein